MLPRVSVSSRGLPISLIILARCLEPLPLCRGQIDSIGALPSYFSTTIIVSIAYLTLLPNHQDVADNPDTPRCLSLLILTEARRWLS